MKKMIDALDYIFYRMYEYVLKHNFVKGDQEEKRVSTIAIYSWVFLIPFIVLVITPIFRSINIGISRYSGTGIGVFLLLLLLSAPLYVRYWKYETYQRIKKRWENEDFKQRKKRGWLIWILIINNIILVPMIVILFEHFDILWWK